MNVPQNVTEYFMKSRIFKEERSENGLNLNALCTALEDSFGLADSASAGARKETLPIEPNGRPTGMSPCWEEREFRKYLCAIKYPQW